MASSGDFCELWAMRKTELSKILRQWKSDGRAVLPNKKWHSKDRDGLTIRDLVASFNGWILNSTEATEFPRARCP